MNELVSIIMPNYNCARYLNQAIDSVIAQTYTNWELIFVDDCSNDNSLDIVTQYDDERIRILQNNQNSGAAISRNYAIREAKGKWIAFLDSDDIWYSAKLEKQIAFMENNNYNFSYTQYCEVDEIGNDIGIIISGPKKITKLMMYSNNYLGCLTVMYNREYIGLIQIENLKKRNDYAFWLKISQKADCFFLDEILAKYRNRIGSVSHQGKFVLFKHHYKLFRYGEKMNTISSVFLAILNCFFWVVKKIVYIKRL